MQQVENKLSAEVRCAEWKAGGENRYAQAICLNKNKGVGMEALVRLCSVQYASYLCFDAPGMQLEKCIPERRE